MPIDFDQYTDHHIHPMDPTIVEFVAYERIDGGWDVFVFEPIGSCPELDASRYDEQHILIERIHSRKELDSVVDRIETQLGIQYQTAPYYREKGSRRIIQKILQHLKQQGASGMYVHATSTDEWTLFIRNKDFSLAAQMVKSNT